MTAATETTQYLTFRLAEEVYALNIAKVRAALDFTSSACTYGKNGEHLRDHAEVAVDGETTVPGALAD
jgi:chemotaxis signal transduction protein